VNGILRRQTDDGGWPLFYEANRESESNSTYSTALVLLTLYELSLTGPTFDPRIHQAIARARTWLHARTPKTGQYWIDYPDAKDRGIPSRGLSAFVIYVLMTTGGTSEDQMRFGDWFAKLDVPIGLNQLETSNQFLTFAGKVHRDGTRYLPLAWELAALGKGAVNMGALDRIRALRFFLLALETWPRDQTAAYEFVSAETLFAINTVFNGGGSSSARRGARQAPTHLQQTQPLPKP
jgi:hypothetical protein